MARVTSEVASESDLGAAEWPLVPLGSILTPVAKSERRVQVRDDVTYTLLSAQLYARGITQKDRVRGANLKTKTWFRVQRGDFLLLKIWARRGSYGFVTQDYDNPIVSGDYPILELDRNRADERFVAYFLSQADAWRALASGAKGSTNRQRVHEREFLQLIEIPLPPLSEQRAIAHVLRTVQRAKEATEAVIAATRELKKSLMWHLFTYGPVPVDQVAQVPLKETEIGPVPEHWEVVRLGEIADIVTGGTPSRSVREYWGGGIPWVKTGEVNYQRIMHTEETITEEGLANSSARILPAGTLLMAMYGQGVTRGRVALLGIEAAINQACAAIQPRIPTSIEFLFQYFWHSYERIRSLGHGAHQKNLSVTLLKTVLLPIPPVQEQEAIAAILNAVDAKYEAEARRSAALDALFNSLLHHLMTGKVRVGDPVSAGATTGLLGASIQAEP